MKKNPKIHELGNPNDIKNVLIVLLKSKQKKGFLLTKKQLLRKIKISEDKLTEALYFLSSLDLVDYFRGSDVQLTNIGYNFSNAFHTKEYDIKSEKEKLAFATLYRQFYPIQKMIDSLLKKKKVDINDLLKDNFFIKELKKIPKWLLLHLKRLSVIDYTKTSTFSISEVGVKLFKVFIIERAIVVFGREFFTLKLTITDSTRTELFDFIQLYEDIFVISYPEIITLRSLLNDERLVGGTDLLTHKSVIDFRKYVKSYYHPNRNSKIALLLPCAKGKPFSSSRTHRRVYKALNGNINGNSKFKNSEKIEEFIISEPLGIIPRKFEMIYPAASYDMTLDAWVPLDTINQNQELDDPSKFFSTIQRNKESSSSMNEQKKIVIQEISNEIYTFFENYSDNFKHIVAYVRSTHKNMVEIAAKRANVEVIYVPDEHDMHKLKDSYGPVSWSLRGMRNTKTLEILIERLEKLRI